MCIPKIIIKAKYLFIGFALNTILFYFELCPTAYLNISVSSHLNLFNYNLCFMPEFFNSKLLFYVRVLKRITHSNK